MAQKRRVSHYQKCIGHELKGRKFKNQTAARRAFRNAVSLCRIRLTRRRPNK